MKYFIFSLVVLIACDTSDPSDNSDDKAQQVVDKAIEAAGGVKFENAVIDFDFRKHHYTSERTGGIFKYHRIKVDSSIVIHDILDNNGFIRIINDDEAVVADTMATKYSSSINSVIYFALLPYGLNDPAVQKEYLEEAMVEGKKYHKIKVTFEEEGGGEDFEDVFIYWINKEDYTVDYIAYEYFNDGGGKRLRKAVNPRIVNGIRFVDYINYKPVNPHVPIQKADSLYLHGGLEKMSEIILEDVEVSLNR